MRASIQVVGLLSALLPLILLSLAPQTALAKCPDEILLNHKFETFDNWTCSCKIGLTSNSHGGDFSFKLSDRTASWQGPVQELPLGTKVFGGRHYYFSGYVKVPQEGSTPNQGVKITMRYTLADDSKLYQTVALNDDITPGRSWVHISADFETLDVNQTSMTLYAEGPDPGVDFFVDTFSLTEIVTDDSWKAAARHRIHSTQRKGVLEVKLKATKKNNLGVTVEIEQVAHEFGFGTAVDSATLQSNENYTKYFLENFEWGTLENDLKWRQTEKDRGVYTFDNADYGIKLLTDNEKKIRGHTLLWASKSKNPEWVQQITDADEMYETTMKRIKKLMRRYKRKVDHWDVNNEMLTNSFYQDIYNNDSKIRYDMFAKAKRADKTAQLFLNDYNVVSTGLRTNEYVAQAEEFKAAGAPVEGMGVQSHLSGSPSGAVMLNRLDRLGVADLPIWVTELDYENADEQERADVLEDMLLAYFSHPKVEGISFWGFWDGKQNKGDASLVDGDDFNDNPAGLMWKRLFHDEWRSRAIVDTTLKTKKFVTLNEVVFYGKYKITVKKRYGKDAGKVVATKYKTLKKSKGSARVVIRV